MKNKYTSVVLHGQLIRHTWPNPDKDPSAVRMAIQHAHFLNENARVKPPNRVAYPVLVTELVETDDPILKIVELALELSGQWKYQITQNGKVQVPWQYGSTDRQETLDQARGRFGSDLVEMEHSVGKPDIETCPNCGSRPGDGATSGCPGCDYEETGPGDYEETGPGDVAAPKEILKPMPARKFHLFIDWKYFGEVIRKEEPAHLNSLLEHQRDNWGWIDDGGWGKTAVFTSLDLTRQIALSQEYTRHESGTVSYGAMWKHLPGVVNPDSPSYDDLLKRIPASYRIDGRYQIRFPSEQEAFDYAHEFNEGLAPVSLEKWVDDRWSPWSSEKATWI